MKSDTLIPGSSHGCTGLKPRLYWTKLGAYQNLHLCLSVLLHTLFRKMLGQHVPRWVTDDGTTAFSNNQHLRCVIVIDFLIAEDHSLPFNTHITANCAIYNAVIRKCGCIVLSDDSKICAQSEILALPFMTPPHTWA